MALLGDLDHAKVLLRATDSQQASAGMETRLGKAQVAVTSYIESKTGRVFGDGPVAPSAIVVEVPVVSSATLGRLYLPVAARTVTEVRYEPVWDGSAWGGGVVVAAADYFLAVTGEQGESWALAMAIGSWLPGRYLVTGTFAGDDADAGIPEDIQYIASYLIAEVVKGEQTSAAATSGPDGATLPLKNPYKNALVVEVLDKYRAEPAVVF